WSILRGTSTRLNPNSPGLTVLIRRLETFDIDLVHLHHRLHDRADFFGALSCNNRHKVAGMICHRPNLSLSRAVHEERDRRRELRGNVWPARVARSDDRAACIACLAEMRPRRSPGRIDAGSGNFVQGLGGSNLQSAPPPAFCWITFGSISQERL